MIRNFIATLLASLALNAFAAVDANQGSRAELETVKGIGPGLSARIVKARESASFRNWGDLVERVGGIGAGTAARLSTAGLTVHGATYDASAMAPAKATRQTAKPHVSKKTGQTDAHPAAGV